MTDWVYDFLMKYPMKSENVSMEAYQQEISVRQFAEERLVQYLNINFWENKRLVRLLGHVCGRLPEDIFLKLALMTNLFWFHSPSLAMVQGFNFGKEGTGAFIHFSQRLMELSDVQITGAISHEIGHVICSHFQANIQGTKQEHEREADELAISWGFKFEIDRIRGRLNQ